MSDKYSNYGRDIAQQPGGASPQPRPTPKAAVAPCRLPAPMKPTGNAPLKRPMWGK